MSQLKRHDRMRLKISDLCRMLPHDDELKKGLDSQSVLRLTISTIRAIKNADFSGDLSAQVYSIYFLTFLMIREYVY